MHPRVGEPQRLAETHELWGNVTGTLVQSSLGNKQESKNVTHTAAGIVAVWASHGGPDRYVAAGGVRIAQTITFSVRGGSLFSCCGHFPQPVQKPPQIQRGQRDERVTG
jgi:hypothetical protein